MTLQLLARPALSPASTMLARPMLHATYITASGSAHPWIAAGARARAAGKAAQRREFSSTPAGSVQAGKPSSASTALKENVKHREEERHVPVVGDEGMGVEGPHYQGNATVHSARSRSGKTPGDQQADSTDKVIGDSLSVTHDHGQWTLFQPIYTQEDLDAVQVVGRTPVTLSDKLAHGAVKFMR